MKNLILSLFVLIIALPYWSQDVDSTQINSDAIENSFNYETGTIEFKTGQAKLTIPKGFRFLNKKQSQYVLTELWGNPLDNNVLGLLVPENKGVLAEDGWAFIVTYEGMGFVADDDAADINYDDLLKEQQKEMNEGNPDRVKQGFQSIKFVGWASSPYYDNNLKVLHWAKELKFGKDQLNMLNYNLRILGRKGVFVLNAVASMNELKEVKASIPKIIKSLHFNKGYKYSDFNEDNGDHVAEWTIGGLVAGKILAKIGMWALILKFWKILAIAIAAAGSFIWKKIKRKREEEENVSTTSTPSEPIKTIENTENKESEVEKSTETSEKTEE